MLLSKTLGLRLLFGKKYQGNIFILKAIDFMIKNLKILIEVCLFVSLENFGILKFVLRYFICL